MEKNKDPRDAALRYLNTQDRTRSEVEKHLKGKGFSKEDILGVLDYLEENRFVDDRNYCGRFVSYSIQKGRGPLRIGRDLTEKGVDASLIREALEERFGDGREYELALDQAEKLMKGMARAAGGEPEDSLDSGEEEMSVRDEGKESTDEADKKEKQLARLARRLASQGFRADVIYRIIGRLR